MVRVDQPPANHRRRFRFSLRMLLAVMTMLCIWLGFKVNAARRQREAVDAIVKAGGSVVYDFQRPANIVGVPVATEPPGARWLRRLLGDEYFEDVIGVGFSGVKKPTIDVLQQLGRLPKLETVNLSDTQVDEEGLRQFVRIGSLRTLQLEFCQNVTDKALKVVAENKNLAELSLLGTGCTDNGVRKYIPQLTQLEYLDVAKIPITNDTALLFQHLLRLKLVHLSRQGYPTAFDLGDAVRQIKAALPKCDVNYWPPRKDQLQE
jgi:hypothetical protein